MSLSGPVWDFSQLVLHTLSRHAREEYGATGQKRRVGGAASRGGEEARIRTHHVRPTKMAEIGSLNVLLLKADERVCVCVRAAV